MRISDWSSDVCSSDLLAAQPAVAFARADREQLDRHAVAFALLHDAQDKQRKIQVVVHQQIAPAYYHLLVALYLRSEEHTSELQSLMRISYAVFCLKQTKKTQIYSPSSMQPTVHTYIRTTTTHSAKLRT